MAEKKTAKKSSRTPSVGLTPEERAAMREHIQEQKAAARGADQEKALLAKLAAMPAADRAIGKRLHEIVKANAPALTPRLWYGMPAYSKDGKVLCYFQSASKFKARYATFGFTDVANLDQGDAWPVAFALKKLTPAEESKIAKLVKRSAS